MRFRVLRTGVVALFLGLPLGIVGCSGDDSQEDTELEATGTEYGAEEATPEGEATDYGDYGTPAADTPLEGGGTYGATDTLADPPLATGAEDTIIDEVNTGADTLGVGVTDVGAAASPIENTLPPEPAPVDTAGFAPAGGDFVGAPVGNGLPEMGTKMPYIVDRGDTLALIAERIYGQPGKWREMAELTGMADPNRVYPGDVVYYHLSPQTEAFAATYVNLPRQEVIVQPGDTLATVASRELGDASKWKHIWRMNDIPNPNAITAGTTLYYVLPGTLTVALDHKDLYLAEVRKLSAPADATPTTNDDMNLLGGVAADEIPETCETTINLADYVDATATLNQAAFVHTVTLAPTEDLFA